MTRTPDPDPAPKATASPAVVHWAGWPNCDAESTLGTHYATDTDRVTCRACWGLLQYALFYTDEMQVTVAERLADGTFQLTDGESANRAPGGERLADEATVARDAEGLSGALATIDECAEAAIEWGTWNGPPVQAKVALFPAAPAFNPAAYTGTPEPAPSCPHVPVGEPRCNACYAGEIISA